VLNLLPLLLIFLVNTLWSSPMVSSWFGHVVFSVFQYKVIFFVLFHFALALVVFLSSSFFSSYEIYDFLLTKFHFLYWIVMLFLLNSLFTLIFVVEVLSTLVFLLIITSSYSSSFFFKNLSLQSFNFFQNQLPYPLLQSILFFFWISLLSSLNLFVFIIFFYKCVATFDWYLVEFIFYFFLKVSSFKEIFSIGMLWFLMLFCIFLKCGIAPLFIWKPTFFKGLTFSILFFYISFFYFFVFVFFIHFLSSYMNLIFYFFSTVSFIIILTGLVTLLFFLCEAFFLKIFFAVSSLLNSLLVFLSMVALHPIDLVVVLA